MAYSLHREGKTLVPTSLLILAALWAFIFWLHPLTAYILIAPALILGFIIVNFFRNPHIDAVQDDSLILAPCDGKVVVIEEVMDKIYFKKPMTQISIFMSPLNVHVNRNPIRGTVQLVRYFPGKYLMAFNPKSSTDNEQNYIAVRNEYVSLAYKQIAGFLARRIKWYVEERQEVKQGAEYGFIKFGSRIDLIIPTDCTVTVTLGDKVKAGLSTIAKIS